MEKKQEAKLFAVLVCLDEQGKKVLSAIYNTCVPTITGSRVPDLTACPPRTQEVLMGLKAVDAAVMMCTATTTVRRQAERFWDRKNGNPTQHERERGYRQQCQEAKRNAAC